MSSGTGLSYNCASCYAGFVICSIKKCLIQCASNPNSKTCLNCLNTQKCTSTFFACTGLKGTSSIPDSCANAVKLTLNSKGAVTISGNTTKATNTVNLTKSSCIKDTSAGPDVFYSIKLFAGNTYDVTVVPSTGYDPSLYAFTDCNNPEKTCVAGIETIKSGGTEQIKIKAQKTGDYYFAVDSWYSSTSLGVGTFTLQVQQIASNTCSASVVGKPCTKNGNECGTGKVNICLLMTTTTGICTCECKPDDKKTPLVNEDTCPGQPTLMCSTKSLETTVNGVKSKKNFCLKTCTPQLYKNECNSPFVCHPSSGAWWYLYGKAVCFYDTTNKGCSKNSNCQVSTGQKCSVSKKNCAYGSTCKPWKSTGDTGICIKAGVCDTVSGLCKPQKTGKVVKVGDPCTGDDDCGDNQTCMMEYDDVKDLGKVETGKNCKANSDCCSGSCSSGFCDVGAPCVLNNRNGYCTIADCVFDKSLTHAKCPTGSHCNKMYNTGFCQKSCKLNAKTGIDACRGNPKDKMGDYECRSWNALSNSSGSFAKGPVCDFGTTFSCATLFPMTCSMFGTWSGTTNTNATNMACRNTKNQKLANSYSSAGYCFDDTASGLVN